MVVAKVSYEELRQQRMEENRKRMEELHLPLLSQALSPVKPSPVKRTPKKRITEEQIVMVRRSNRFANKSIPSYSEFVTVRRNIMLPRTRGIYKPRDLSNRVYASDEAREYATKKAEEFESTLGSDHPTLVKPMLPSHVSGGFWLGIPVYFCKKYLPRGDETVTLVDEEGEEYSVVYLARKTGLSGGWKGFAVAHELVDGDAIVFQVIKPKILKVYIIRANGYKEENNL